MSPEVSDTGARRPLRIAVVQTGESTEDLAANDAVIEALVRRAATEGPQTPDLVLLPELITTPYFCTSRAVDRSGWAETLPGPTTRRFSALAAELGVAIVWGMYERTGADVLHNSAVAVDRTGRLLSWTDADGNPRPAYRKMSLPANHVGGVDVDEKFFFSPGQGPVVLDLLGTRFACVICYDRSFPEHWALARAMGAEVVLAVVSSLGNREELFTAELQVRAMESQTYVVAANRAGGEDLNGHHADYFGLSCVIDPTGGVVVQAPAHEAGHVLTTEIDLEDVTRTRAHFPLSRDRRADVVGLLSRLVSAG